MGPAADRRAGGRVLAAALVAATGLAACSSGGSSGDAAQSSNASDRLPQGSETVRLDPADFTVDITNKYWPMKPGDTLVYDERDENGTLTHDVVSVLDTTDTINGVATRVVHDVATQNGQTIEDTTDWYAQDSKGNLWYFGEQTAEYQNGQVSSTEGSWTAGKDGAQAGVLLPADPRAGMTYRQEYL